MKIIICTIKDWNINKANELKKIYENHHDIYIWDSKEQLSLDNVKQINPDYIFLPHWSYMIPESICDNYKCVIFHMTDLPFGRGGSPLQNLIVRGYTKTKISAISVVKELDAGPVYMKQDLELYGTATEIFTRAADIIFDKMIPYIIENNPIPQPQEGEVVVFKRRKPQEGEILPQMPLNVIYDYIRMLDAQGYPNAFMQFGKYRIDFSKAVYENNRLTAMVEFIEEEAKDE